MFIFFNFLFLGGKIILWYVEQIQPHQIYYLKFSSSRLKEQIWAKAKGPPEWHGMVLKASYYNTSKTRLFGASNKNNQNFISR